MRILTVLLLAGLCDVAHAEDERDRDTARWLVGGSLAASIGVLVVGEAADSDAATATGLTINVVAPSAGHVYAGAYVHAAVTSTLRGAALAGLFYSHADQNDPNLPLAVLSGAVFCGLAAYDIVDAPRAVDRHNARILVAPTALPTADGPAWGLAATGAF